MKLVGTILLACLLLGAALAGCVAVINDEDSMGHTIHSRSGTIQLSSHEYDDGYYEDEYDDGYGRGGDGGYSDGNQGYGGGGGRSGDNDGEGSCRSFCNNTIVPDPRDDPDRDRERR